MSVMSKDVYHVQTFWCWLLQNMFVIFSHVPKRRWHSKHSSQGRQGHGFLHCQYHGTWVLTLKRTRASTAMLLSYFPCDIAVSAADRLRELSLTWHPKVSKMGIILCNLFFFSILIQSVNMFSPKRPIDYNSSVTWIVFCRLTDDDMMTSSRANIFRVTGHLCREYTDYRWSPCTEASDTELWCFLWSAPEWKVE